jgi:hypothetical protein
MTCRRRKHFLTIAAVLLWGSMGLTCEDAAADPSTTERPISLQVEIESSYRYRDGYVAIVNLVAITEDPIQACDLTLSWNSSSVSFATAIEHPEFDDDGELFANGQLGANSISHIVDLRHGSATAVGSIRLAYVVLIIDDLTPVKLTIDGEFAAPDGEPFTVVIRKSATVDAGV